MSTRPGRFHQHGVEFARNEGGAAEVDFPRSVDDAGHPAARVGGEEGPELPRAVLGGIEPHGPNERDFLYVPPAMQRAGILAHGVGYGNVALSYEPSFLLVASEGRRCRRLAPGELFAMSCHPAPAPWTQE
jgi:hypothetical protein